MIGERRCEALVEAPDECRVPQVRCGQPAAWYVEQERWPHYWVCEEHALRALTHDQTVTDADGELVDADVVATAAAMRRLPRPPLVPLSERETLPAPTEAP